jgi:hypothetical protein
MNADDDELCHLSDLRITRASEIDLSRSFSYEEVMVAAESAYRRGYDQGVDACWHAFRSGADGDLVDRWGDDVTAWRHRLPGTGWLPPTEPRGRRRIRYGVEGA